MKIAFVHEWLTTYAGSEKVLAEMLAEFPGSDVYCLIDFLSEKDRKEFGGWRPRTTFLQKIPFIRYLYKQALPLMPLAIEQHDLSAYDVIISNSHAVAKGVIARPDQLHICYCYSPMRYAWDLQNQYLQESRLDWGLPGYIAKTIFHKMRIWDVRSAFGVDHFIACSSYIARRIHKAYRRPSTVIYCNVDVTGFTIGGEREDYYITSSRMVPYKKQHLIVEAFAKMPDRKLIVIGTGPQFKRIKALATPNVTIMGYQEFEVLKHHLQRAKAFIFAAEEDFGIAPLEAQACGTPVLAFARGGASETVIHGVTGLHFHEQTADAICEAVKAFEALPEGTFDPLAIRAHAERFSTERFRHDFGSFVRSAWQAHASRLEAQRTQAKFPAPPVPVPDEAFLESAAAPAAGAHVRPGLKLATVPLAAVPEHEHELELTFAATSAERNTM